MASDQSLTTVLSKHIKILGREELSPEPVKDAKGRTCIVDLMLSRTMYGNHADEREHLIVELKRPDHPINMEALSQVERYAFAVAGDERSRDTKTRWTFWAVSNDVTEDARRKSIQRDKPPGQVHDDQELSLTIWVKPWSQVFRDCQARLHFFKQHLKYETSDEVALAKLKEMHEKHFPQEVEVG